jgi:hypothetical protein
MYCKCRNMPKNMKNHIFTSKSFRGKELLCYGSYVYFYNLPIIPLPEIGLQ